MGLALNKTVLKQQRDQLAMYQRFLPSLDLKRQQLLVDYRRAKETLSATEREFDAKVTQEEGLLSLLGASEQDVSGLISISQVTIEHESALGVRLPVLGEIIFHKTEYSMLAKPFWVDFLVELLETLARLHVRREIERLRMERLREAARKIQQRVNLFEKVLIPQAERDIQRIKIYLADAERAAVVRSKLAKAKRKKDQSPRGVD